MPIDRQQLPHDPERLQQMVLDLIAQLDAEQLRRIKTERLLQQLLEARSGPRSEQLSPDQLRLFAAELAQQGVKVEEPAGAESTGKDADMPPPGAGGTPDDTAPGQPRRRALPRNLKRERIVHDLAEADKHCAECGQDLRPIGEETSERYEYIPAQMLVIEEVCQKYACDCAPRAQRAEEGPMCVTA